MLTTYTADELAQQAADRLKDAEGKARAERDRNECILTPPAGTAPAREIRDEDRQPTQQGGLF